MSDIQTISQGNYILSNMAAQKLYAQSPLTTGVSGTSAYIGIEPSALNNETVLWSGTATTSFNLIEAPSAFNQLRIKFDEMGNGNRYGYMWCNDTTISPLGAVGLNFLTNDSSDGIHINASKFTVDGTNLTMNYCSKKWLTLGDSTQTWGSTSTLGTTKVFEIVGINRKENV